MGRYRFVEPELHRIDLSDGDWIKVDREMNFRDSNEIFRARQRGDIIGALTRMIREWSFKDHDCESSPPGHDCKIMPITEDAIANLDQDTVVEISTATQEYHIQFQEEKKARLTNAKLEAL